MAIEFQLGKDAPPFQEAVDAFLAKRIMTKEAFNALAAAMKVKAFTAAYVYAADQLQAVYDGVRLAIEKGSTLADFKEEAGEILTRPWHRETVFRTNVLAAYGKGHFDRAQELRELRPYARYSAVMDGRTRPSHAALHGRIYPLEHPFWKTYWPPWGYNCRCGVTTISQLEVAEQKLRVRQDMSDLPVPDQKFVSPAAGDWQPDLGRLPVSLKQGVLESLLRAYRPGIFVDIERSNYLALVRKHLTPADLADFEVLLWAEDLVGVSGYREWVEGVLTKQRQQGELYPVGNIPGAVIERLAQKPRLALTLIDDEVVLHMAREAKKRRGAALTANEIAMIPEKIKSAQWYEDLQDPALLLAWIRQGDEWVKVVIRLDQKVGRGVSNRLVSGGIVQTRNIGDTRRYKRI